MTDAASFGHQMWRVSPDLLSFLDRDGRFVETNPAWLSTLGWSPDEIISKSFLDFLHPDDVQRTTTVFDEMKKGQPALYFENRYRCKDGTYKWLSWIAVPEGELFFCSARDVTRDKERVRALQTHEDEALLREQFIAILGHDLRNPLAAIESAIRIASREDHNDRTAEMFASIQGSAMRMASLIDTIMDFARARLGGGIPLDLVANHNPRDGIEHVIAEIRLAHPDMEILLDYEFQGTLTCDPTRLDQTLSNLLANAVTHGSSHKPISVTASRIDDAFVMSVTNSGTPILRDAIPTLFEPFARRADSGSLQGLGLGLYIAAQIAEAHGGMISARSDETETRFTFKMPIA